MGWSFPWVSSYGSDFNFDYHVSFTPEQIAEDKAYYNYEVRPNTLSDEVGRTIGARCSAPIPATRGALICSMVPTITSILRRKAATRPASNSRWSGYAGTISIEALRSAAAADLTTSNRALRRAAGNGARIVTHATFPANDPERAPSRPIGAGMVSGRASERAFFAISALLFAASTAATIVW